MQNGNMLGYRNGKNKSEVKKKKPIHKAFSMMSFICVLIVLCRWTGPFLKKLTTNHPTEYLQPCSLILYCLMYCRPFSGLKII